MGTLEYIYWHTSTTAEFVSVALLFGYDYEVAITFLNLEILETMQICLN